MKLKFFFIFLLGLGFGWVFDRIFLISQAKAGRPQTKLESKGIEGSKRSVNSNGMFPSLPTPPKEGASNRTAEAVRGVPQNANEALARLLFEIENSDPKKKLDSMAIMGRLQELRDFGEDGSRVIQEFLNSQQDIVLGEGSGPSSGRAAMFPSLRVALLETLYKMDDPTARAASLDVLRKTASGLEAVLAARNLERVAPGVYREDAIKAANEILPNLPDLGDAAKRSRGAWLEYQAFDILGHYQAKESIPQIESILKNRPDLAPYWMNALLQFSSEDQIASIQHLMGDERVAKTVGNSYFLSQLDFQNEKTRQFAADLFSNQWSSRQKRQFLRQVAQSGGLPPVDRVMQGGDEGNPRKAQKSRIESSLQLLNELEPTIKDAALKERTDAARKQLVQQLQNVP